MPNEPEPYDLDQRVQVKKTLPATPPPRLHPIATSPDQPIAIRTRSQTRNSQPPVNLAMKLKQSLLVTPSQAFHNFFPKALLSLCSTRVKDLSILAPNLETGESLEHHQLRHHPKYKRFWEEYYYNEL